MSGWGCPHEVEGECQRVAGKKCDPGMKGCTLSGRFKFSSSEKNISRRVRENPAPSEDQKKSK
ncbi:hypothetical protein F3F96_10725 [Mariprofundus sp. NF]|uniref:hypothetical protein n=1 Tax=Mariprofundus sp. NF TaxID=2608716 RepID=UPI0015A44B15|nr:hypothetical protein [Mariprofundus sp. NF]NWF39608.1 hypothetical protein [Mariprofundus sp. NF]